MAGFLASEILFSFDQLHKANRKIQELVKEQDSLIDIFSEERERRDIEEENLRKKLKVSLRICYMILLVLIF